MNAYAVPNVVDGVVQGRLPQTLGKWTDPFAQMFNQSYNTNTFTAFFQDTYSPIRNLSLHFGFKSVLSTTRVGNGFLNPSFYGAGAEIASGVGLTTSKPFLPHISVDWRFLPGHEFFIDISENVHTYAESGYHLSNSPFAVTQSAYNSSVAALHPETAWTYAAGYRYSSPIVSASVYGYRTNFQNRLQQVTSGSIINPQSVVENVGGVTMNGVDVGVTVNPITNLALTNSISYDHAVYDNNISNAGISYNTKNVQIVNYPRFMYKGRLSYEWHNATAYIDGNYIGARNYSYTGDVKVPGYWMANLGIQYKLSNLGKYDKKLAVVKNLIFSLNVTNLTNTHYISTMGANGNPMAISSGALTYASLAPGAPRMFFGSIRGEF
ncbi:TonB-dependent receptor [Komagataeibacter nataicola]|nr:TonB-dependent receptor [Komagataeibacter nataicola]